MSATLQRRRVAVFLGVAFGLSWLTAVVIYATGGLDSGPMLLPGVPQSLVLVAGPCMFAPAIANVATRIATGEGFDRTLIRPHVRARWRPYLVAWLAPVGLVVAGAALYFLAYPGQFGGLGAVGSFVPAVEGSPAMSAEAFLALQLGQLLVIAPVVNAPVHLRRGVRLAGLPAAEAPAARAASGAPGPRRHLGRLALAHHRVWTNKL